MSIEYTEFFVKRKALLSIIEKLNAFQPDLVSGYPFGAFMAACEQLKGNLKISPIQVNCSGEILSQAMRERIREAFGIDPVNMYASSESICIAASNKSCSNMHIFEDMNILECIEKDGGSVAPGEEGNAVLTNLYNYTLPLIRYRMNDRITIKNGCCDECVQPYPVIENINGRSEDVLYFRNSDGNEEPVFYSFISIFYHKGIKLFRIVQAEQNLLKIKVVFENRDEIPEIIQYLDAGLSAIFRKKGLVNLVKYTIESVDFIDIDNISGKFRYIIPFKNKKADKAGIV